MMDVLTEQQLAEVLPDVLAAPKDGGVIETLCFRPDIGERNFVNRLELSVSEGVIGDRWREKPWLRLPDGSPDPRIQVSILPKRVLDLVWFDRDRVIHPGDTMIADIDVSEDNMPVGTRLKIGAAVVEVSDVFNTACRKWHERYGGESIAWINRPHNKPKRLRGILCSIVKGGIVTLDDRIVKLAEGPGFEPGDRFDTVTD